MNLITRETALLMLIAVISLPSPAQRNGGPVPNSNLTTVRREDIENRRWRIAKYRGIEINNSGQMQEMVNTNRPAEIAFANGQVHGSPGCGGLVGTYTISGDKLISDVDILLAGLCPSNQFDQSSLVMKALKGERRIEKDGSNILLLDKNGAAMVLLVPL
ncbi:MAG TPA: META domain-containing protein [Acidobacteriaceae bacterium]|jgi:heat shock protein HslJ